ncbi:MAG: nucleotide exchange factor GrpE [Flavobacteriales bacterium]|jgi:molecular chaperone GrpE|nr:nucleotide exchange factor GrpE [Flavobacteriales bacterium]MBK7943680.1 nucleotide exchange factor GrpE [Flavobacteriales bacterium]MBK9699636.1 nucleotide exchange factor GrpE [Flavobacteriales bacterium]
MRRIFGKARKPMTDRPQAAAEAEHPAKPTTHALPADAADEARKDALTAASEAAAEHVMHDAEADGREDINTLQAELDQAMAEAADLKDKWLRLNADFDNFRKRTARERLDLIQFAAENALKNVLPVLDDMERAIANNVRTEDLAVVKEGFHLIQNKLLHILGSQGVKPMSEVKGQPFDVDRHEAITKAPAPSPELKGRVLDVVENGYTLHDKVIRYAKVVVGE